MSFAFYSNCAADVGIMSSEDYNKHGPSGMKRTHKDDDPDYKCEAESSVPKRALLSRDSK